MAHPTDATLGLVHALQSATTDDLAAVRERISQLQADLHALHELEKFLHKRLRQPPQKSLDERHAIEQAVAEEQRNGWSHRSLPPGAADLVAVLERLEGWTPLTDLARLIGRSDSAVRAIIGHNRKVFILNSANRVRLRTKEAINEQADLERWLQDKDDEDDRNEQDSDGQANSGGESNPPTAAKAALAKTPPAPAPIAAPAKQPSSVKQADPDAATKRDLARVLTVLTHLGNCSLSVAADNVIISEDELKPLLYQLEDKGYLTFKNRFITLRQFDPK
jgi:hypothetical protein